MHTHVLEFDGVYRLDEEGRLRFEPGQEPTQDALNGLAADLLVGLKKLTERHDAEMATRARETVGREEPEQLDFPDFAADSGALGQAGGGTAGVREGEAERLTNGKFARAEDLHLFASEVIPGQDRARLERLCGYLLRPPFAAERLEQREDGLLTYRLSKPDKQGNTKLVMRPVELMMRLASLIPAPRLATVRYYGVLAAGSRDRAKVTPRPIAAAKDDKAPTLANRYPAAVMTWLLMWMAPERLGALLKFGMPPTSDPADVAKKRWGWHNADAWLKWQALMRRLWGIEPLTCPQCGGRMKPKKVVTVPTLARRARKRRGGSQWARGPPTLPGVAAQPLT